MGVGAPLGVTRAYYVAYEIGLPLSLVVYWVANKISPPAISFPLSEWREPKDYVRPEERDVVIEGVAPTVHESAESGVEKKIGSPSVVEV